MTTQLFNTVAAQLRGGNSVEDVAKINGLSEQRVRLVLKYGTYEKYFLTKTNAAVVKARKRVEAQNAAKKKLDEIVAKPENQIKRGTDPMVVTVDEWNAVLREQGILHQRLDAQLAHLKSVAARVEVKKAKRSLFTWGNK